MSDQVELCFNFAWKGDVVFYKHNKKYWKHKISYDLFVSNKQITYGFFTYHLSWQNW